MAIEERRGCGYRKVGGIYLVGTGLGVVCDRLPYNLHVCPVCGNGIKQQMGFAWIEFERMAGQHSVCNVSEKELISLPLGELQKTIKNNTSICNCEAGTQCPICIPVPTEKQGLLWVGNKFYTPGKFIEESNRLGVSKRISHVPRGLIIGQTWIYLAHPKAGKNERAELVPAIFYAFRPTAIEKIITESQSKDKEEMKSLLERGIKPVVVPDNDKEHQGNVYQE